MSVMHIVLTVVVSAAVVAVVGALVYRNNVKKIEREFARLKADYEEYKTKLASLKG